MSKAPDANDVLREHGPDELRRRLDRAAAAAAALNGHGRRGDGQSNGRADHENEREPADGAELDTEDIEAEIARLVKLGPIEYERERKPAAKRLGLRNTALDGIVKGARGAAGDDTAGQGRPLSLPEPVPCEDLVDGCELLDALVAALQRYVVLAKNETRAIALWVLHAYLFEVFTCTPRLAITSPERRCGKTTLLDVLAQLLPRVLSVAGISPAAVFRTVELARPTLLIDEADTFLPQNDDLRRVLNSGHRRGGNEVRLVGDGYDPRQFSTHTPVAIAMIGKLPSTLADRSIPIRLRRRRADEAVQSFRADRADDLGRVASMAARWASDNAAEVRDADPEMAGLFNRDADNWRPLFAIADRAGGPWPNWAREAARAPVADGVADDESTGALLLADIRDAFVTRDPDRISSEDLVAYLNGREDRSWSEGKSGKPLSKVQLARLLKQFEIFPGNLRLDEVVKGYKREDFKDAFERYLPPEGGSETLHRYVPRGTSDAGDFDPLQAGTV
jgi:putative DNA primase/helicase